MRILFLTQVLPYPLDAGPKVRAYYVLRHLAQRHDVTLVSFVRAEDTPAALTHLRGVCAAVHTVPMTRSRVADARFLAASLVQNRPFIIARDWSPAMARLLTEPAGSAAFDAVHADQLWMAPYAQLVRNVAPARPLTVLDQHNAVYLIPGRLAADEHNPLKRGLLALEARKLARYEAAVCRRFDRVTWVTQEDFAAVQRLPAPDDGPDAAQLPNDGVIPICADPGATASEALGSDASACAPAGSSARPPQPVSTTHAMLAMPTTHAPGTQLGPPVSWDGQRRPRRGSQGVVP